MKTSWSFPVLGAFLASMSLLAGCNPNQMSNHPGSPPAINEVRPEAAASIRPRPMAQDPGTPHHYGVPAMREYAQYQAGEVGPGANLGISEDQFRMGPTSGRKQGVRENVYPYGRTRLDSSK